MRMIALRPNAKIMREIQRLSDKEGISLNKAAIFLIERGLNMTDDLHTIIKDIEEWIEMHRRIVGSLHLKQSKTLSLADKILGSELMEKTNLGG